MPHFQHPSSPSTTTSLSLNGAEAVKHGGQRRRLWGTLGCITVCRKRQFIRRYCLCAGPESPRYHPRPCISYRLELLASDWLAVVGVGRRRSILVEVPELQWTQRGGGLMNASHGAPFRPLQQSTFVSVRAAAGLHYLTYHLHPPPHPFVQ